jgi:EpsI family protein
MFFDAAQAAKLLQAMGIPVFLDSNLLHLPNIVLEVADVCSGIASIFALLVLGILYAYLLPITPVRKTLLVASAVPLAIIVNLFRITVTVALAYYYGPVVLQSIFHEFTGTFNFLLSVSLLVVLGESLHSTSRLHEQRSEGEHPGLAAIAGRASGWIPVAVGAVILGTTIWGADVLERVATGAAPIGLERLPSSFGPYATAVPVWLDVYKDPKADEALTRFYSTTAGISIELFVGHRANGGRGDRLQSPKLVLPERWNYLWVKPAAIKTAGTEQIEANWMLTQRSDAKRVVLYWYESRGHAFTGELYYRAALLKARFLHGSSDMAVVRIATPVLADERQEDAQNRLTGFVIQMYPALGKLLRRERALGIQSFQ